MIDQFFSGWKRRRNCPDEVLPQLEMRRSNLDSLPDVTTPNNYGLRTYQPGDEAVWCVIMEGNIGSNWTIARCSAELIEDDQFLPENLFFVTCQGRPVGSACAWRQRSDDQKVGRLHMVAVLEAHRRQGLGALLNAAVLNRLKVLGYSEAHLLTNDWRLAAIKSYFAVQFEPYMTHPSHCERWKRIMDNLGLPQSMDSE